MKAFSVNIRFDLPQAGAIPIAAEDKDDAIKRANDLFRNCRNVEVLEAIEVPLSALVENMDVRELVEDAEIVEDAPSKVN